MNGSSAMPTCKVFLIERPQQPALPAQGKDAGPADVQQETTLVEGIEENVLAALASAPKQRLSLIRLQEGLYPHYEEHEVATAVEVMLKAGTLRRMRGRWCVVAPAAIGPQS